MITAAAIVLFLVAVALVAPSLVLLVECAAAWFPRRVLEEEGPSRTATRVVVLVPAHDESKVVGRSLEAIRPELAAGDRVLVVADNCTDETAAVARSAGAEVLERYDPRRRGKGYALDAGIAHLSSNPPDVVIVLDADCRVAPGSIRKLAEVAASEGRPAQAQDLLTLPDHASPLARVSAFAFLVKNHVRPMGLKRLGLPCQLMGTGMAFPWSVIRTAPPFGSHLAEDVQMGFELASLGFAPVYCPDALITSAPPKRTKAAQGQRRRWEHGHISTLLDTAPKLIYRGIVGRKLHVAAMGIDVVVPPLALYVIVLVMNLSADLLFAFRGGSWAPLAIGSLGLAFVMLGVFLAWLKFGRKMFPARYLLMVPPYVLWKLPLYLSFSIRGPHATWDRAERSTSGF